MEFIQRDFNETNAIVDLIRKMDTIDVDYVNSVSDEIYKKQPFLLSVLSGFHLDVTPIELEELVKSYCLIWEYYKGNANVHRNKITQKII